MRINKNDLAFWVCYDRYVDNKTTEKVVVFATNDREEAIAFLRQIELNTSKEYYLVLNRGEIEEDL